MYNNNHLKLPYSQISCTIKQQGFFKDIRGSQCGSMLDPNNSHTCLHSLSLNSDNRMNCKWTKTKRFVPTCLAQTKGSARSYNYRGEVNTHRQTDTEDMRRECLMTEFCWEFQYVLKLYCDDVAVFGLAACHWIHAVSAGESQLLCSATWLAG